LCSKFNLKGIIPYKRIFLLKFTLSSASLSVPNEDFVLRENIPGLECVAKRKQLLLTVGEIVRMLKVNLYWA
jgi:hypothetical protein